MILSCSQNIREAVTAMLILWMTKLRLRKSKILPRPLGQEVS